MRFPAGLRALNHDEFRVFFWAQMVALVGGWMQTVAQSWLVLQLTSSPLLLGLIGTLQFAPVTVFSLVAGAAADRLPKRALLIFTQTILAGQALTLAVLVLTGLVQYWHVAVLGLVLGFANVLDMPARQSFVMELVGRDDVINAVALNSAGFNTARIVGPAVAGLVIGGFGLVPAFVANSVGFVVVIVTLLTLRTHGRPAGPRGPMVAEIVEGLRYARRTPRIMLSLGLLFVVSLCVFNFTVYVPLLVRDVLRLGPEGFGFLMAALGVGAVAGALTLGSLGSHEPPIPTLFGAAAVALTSLLSLGFVRHVWVAVVLLFVTGYFGTVLVAGCNTVMQLTVPDDLRGRVMSLYTWVWGGTFPVGAFLVGAISQGWGVSTTFRVAGVFGFATLGVVAAWWSWRGKTSGAGRIGTWNG